MKVKTSAHLCLAVFLLLVAACDSNGLKSSLQKKEVPERRRITYHLLPLNDSGATILKKRFSAGQRILIFALNRMDAAHGMKADTLIVPDDLQADFMEYSPFPFRAPFLEKVHKIVFFSYPAQAFAAYQNGRLVRWGPTSMGRKKDPTPAGLYFCNWKAEETTSTFDDEWVLKWNFNVENKEGIGWHLYDMPGYPASHSCLRLLERDARYLYDWAEQWIQSGENNVVAQGTPLVVFGTYPFDGPRPWLSLVADPDALTITPEMLEQEVKPFLPRILQQQQRRDSAETSPR